MVGFNEKSDEYALGIVLVDFVYTKNDDFHFTAQQNV